MPAPPPKGISVIDSAFLFLIYNTALLLLLVVIFELIAGRWRKGVSMLRQIPIGLIIGLIGVIVIQTHWELEPGVIFDTRSILLSISGLFFGTVPTLIAMVITGIFRYYEGGIGVVTGTLVIFFTGSIGLLWRHLYHKQLAQYTFYDFFLFGFVVHIIMLALMLTFPWNVAKNVLENITLPVLAIYPAGIALLGMIMSNRIQKDILNEKIKEDETKFRIIAGHTHDWEYWIAPDHRFLFCSSSCLPVTGYTDSEFINNAELFDSIIFTDDKTNYKQHRHEADGMKPGRLDFRIIHRDGSIRWIGHVCVPVYNDDRVYLGIRGSNRDITERKEAENKMLDIQNEMKELLDVAEQSRKVLLSVVEDQKLAQEEIIILNNELEERVVQRTQELERANNELEAFSYSVSHDLRAPLRAINGFTKILHDTRNESLNEKDKELLGDVLKNTKYMNLLIDDLLELSRLSRKDIKKDSIDMQKLFQQTFDELKEHDKRNNIAFTIDELPYAHGDHSLIKQVIVNLLSNALKFTGKISRPVITISGKIESSLCIYSVSDNGAGFDKKYYKNLFGVFQRLHRTDEFAGTGVGLAIVKRIVQRHGGTAWAESEPNNGATFYFSIPLQ